ncbi:MULTISPECIES: hypothetical protein [Ulvibacterium]|nr:hypothetical protein [Ulvibacterium marinum]
MKHTKKQRKENNTVADRLLTRHESWRNHRRHTTLALIRFS